jgi:hypothetical protein
MKTTMDSKLLINWYIDPPLYFCNQNEADEEYVPIFTHLHRRMEGNTGGNLITERIGSSFSNCTFSLAKDVISPHFSPGFVAINPHKLALSDS